jgi:hypothetical protein
MKESGKSDLGEGRRLDAYGERSDMSKTTSKLDAIWHGG